MSNRNFDNRFPAALHVIAEATGGLIDDDGDPIDELGIGQNANVRLSTDTFTLRDYCWCEGSLHPEPDSDDDAYAYEQPSGGTSPDCPANFEYPKLGFKAYWYKRIGRGLETNITLTDEQLDLMLEDCLAQIRTLRTQQKA